MINIRPREMVLNLLQDLDCEYHDLYPVEQGDEWHLIAKICGHEVRFYFTPKGDKLRSMYISDNE